MSMRLLVPREREVRDLGVRAGGNAPIVRARRPGLAALAAGEVLGQGSSQDGDLRMPRIALLENRVSCGANPSVEHVGIEDRAAARKS
ncbi:MAG: hypothetical protein U0166_03515 [Acidobacteriota bacterium]